MYVRWHISANAKPKEKRVQNKTRYTKHGYNYKTRAHHFKKHKTISQNAFMFFEMVCMCFHRAMHTISKAPSDPSANGVT